MATFYRYQDKIEDMEVEKELREAFVSLLTHDLRTPLTIILGAAQFILRKPNDFNICQASAKRIVQQVNRVGKMTADLLDANRLRSGEPIPLKKERVELSDLIQDTLSDLTTIHGNRFVLHSENKIEISIDPNGVRRIIENLCNNAVKYGAQDTPVTIMLEQNEKDIIISIQNEGDLISADDQKSLFQQFRRSEKAQTSNKRGWGIGLTLVRGLARAHAGDVTVKSEPHTGTVFTVTLPKNA